MQRNPFIADLPLHGAGSLGHLKKGFEFGLRVRTAQAARDVQALFEILARFVAGVKDQEGAGKKRC